ncbi:MAG: hypothetical protein CMM52_15230 [Rhodospirillaceae bacterium]|nr:hypothetical protein [Rhodospirillaceae bacterium]|tara:strand:+ start:2183 stop:2386 length:204 start_codon:yes stop_codon:yes gene_type:complete
MSQATMIEKPRIEIVISGNRGYFFALSKPSQSNAQKQHNADHSEGNVGNNLNLLNYNAYGGLGGKRH